MDHEEWTSERFEEHRARLRAVAYRMLGSTSDADDAVQEVWIRLNRSDPSAIDNIGGWLTTVVARVALDMLRSRASRRDEPSDPLPLERAADGRRGVDPEYEATLADSVGSALLVVLDTLSASERLAFVLHDMFAIPFEEIAPILGRSPNAVKQLASRARHKVQGGTPPIDEDPARRRRIVDAFLAASRSGNLNALIALLHPDITMHADQAAVRMGSTREVIGAPAVAAVFSGRALGAQPAIVDDVIGMVWIVADRPKVVWEFTVENETIVRIDMIADADALAAADVVVLH